MYEQDQGLLSMAQSQFTKAGIRKSMQNTWEIAVVDDREHD